jgi:hypothetical protein
VVSLSLLIIIAVVWIGGRRLSFFKTSEQVAVVTFEKEESKEFKQTLQMDLAKLQQTRIQRPDEKRYVDEYNQKVDTINTLKAQKKVRPEDRGDIAFLMAQYKKELEGQFARNRNASAPIRSTTNAPQIESEADTQAVISLVGNVDQAIAKKNVGETETIKAVAQQIGVAISDNNDVAVKDKIPNRSRDEANALINGVQDFANQQNRTVYLTVGGQTRTITPISTFTRPNPKE